MTPRGKQKSQQILNTLILLACDKGEYQIERSTNEEIARVLNMRLLADKVVELGYINSISHETFWLNMAEIELNVLTGQCLNRRIDDIEVIRKEVLAW